MKTAENYRTELGRFLDTFGPEDGPKYFRLGLSYGEAVIVAGLQAVSADLDELRHQVAALQQAFDEYASEDDPPDYGT